MPINVSDQGLFNSLIFLGFFLVFPEVSGGSGKPSFPSPSAGDLRELPRVPLRGEASLGFSRQEHWSGLPFPSPMHESEK